MIVPGSIVILGVMGAVSGHDLFISRVTAVKVTHFAQHQKDQYKKGLVRSEVGHVILIVLESIRIGR